MCTFREFYFNFAKGNEFICAGDSVAVIALDIFCKDLRAMLLEFAKKIIHIGAVALLAVFISPGITLAEVITVEGSGLYILDEHNETMEQAKEKAREDALRAALEQVAVTITGATDEANQVILHDEIVAVAAGVMKVQKVKYDLKVADDDMVEVRATVTVEVDTDEVN